MSGMSRSNAKRLYHPLARAQSVAISRDNERTNVSKLLCFSRSRRQEFQDIGRRPSCNDAGLPRHDGYTAA
jgi:hypothetical protein